MTRGDTAFKGGSRSSVIIGRDFGRKTIKIATCSGCGSYASFNDVGLRVVLVVRQK